MNAHHCAVHCLGLIPYEAAWRLQEQYAAEIAAGTRPPTLLLLEHPHTYTFGRRGKAENLLWDAAELAGRGVAVHWVDRGGDVTYHGPGQLVGYPLLPLGKMADYVGYLRKLEEVLVLALARFGVMAERIEGLTGVWVKSKTCDEPCPERSRRGSRTIQNPKPVVSLALSEAEGEAEPSKIAKIASIGVKVDVHGVTRHGFALNVSPDMSYWEGIVACGLEGYAQTSLAELLDPAPPMDAMMDAVQAAFGEVFGMEIQP